MYNSEEKAKEYFVHYFRLLAKHAGMNWNSDNDAEIEAAIEDLIDSAVERIKKESAASAAG
jgi:hypothetical protein